MQWHFERQSSEEALQKYQLCHSEKVDPSFPRMQPSQTNVHCKSKYRICTIDTIPRDIPGVSPSSTDPISGLRYHSIEIYSSIWTLSVPYVSW